MTKFILFITFISAASFSFGQSIDNAYGPVPTREFIKTIGETYILLPLNKSDVQQGYDSFESKNNKKLPASASGMHLTLISAEQDKRAYFKDSVGNEYDTFVNGYNVFDIIPLNDFIAAKKLFLNKPLWLNDDEIRNGNPLDLDDRTPSIKNLRFDKVIVTDITLSWTNNAPFVFHVKTAKGQTGYIETSVSGTNNTKLPENLFYTHFYDKDPKTLYHFTPAMWQIIKGGGLPVRGMPLDAAILMMGRPTKINTSTLGTKVRTQLVYGDTDPSYYYFEGNKYVGRN
ncbi:hypothetical protein [Mucilaginibacter sp.]